MSSGAKRRTLSRPKTKVAVMPNPPNAHAVLERLQKGNERYVSRGARGDPQTRSASVDGSSIAAVLVCSDLRAAPEDIFDVPVGALHVLQTAAFVADESEAAGVELARLTDGVGFAIVLGHTPCGVLDACLAVPADRFGGISKAVHDSRDKIGPPAREPSGLGRAHAGRMAERLRALLKETPDVVVAAAHYDEDTGEVSFL